MKKILSILLGFAMLYNFSACSDNDYTSKYTDPGETSIASCDKLMTGVFYTGARFTYNSYWRLYTWENSGVAKFAQTIGFTNTDGTRYSIADSYANNRWEDFYNTLTQFRELQVTYNKLTPEEKEKNRVFWCVSEIFVYDHLSQVIDAFGDVPFSEAGYLTTMGADSLMYSYPSYEKTTDLYTMMLDNLGNLSQELNGIGVTGLERQDFINNGDIDKWIKYCNSLRLRLATRVATQGELATKGKQVVKEILEGNYPIVEELKQNIQVLSFDNDISSTADPAGLNFGDAFRNGYKEHSFASQAMLDVLITEEALGENDPRLIIMYSKNSKDEYRGLSTREPYAEQLANTNIEEKSRVYSRIDSTTVIYNRNLKSPIITAAEVYFTKAEAYQRGWASGDAKQAFINGVLESVKFYYDQNNDALNRELTASPIRKVEMPAESKIIAYAQKMWDKATNKEEVIATQKWLNFGFMQSTQAWHEYRRTGYPELYFPTDDLAQILKTPPYRVRYPFSERNYNTDNYNKQVATMPDGDSYYTKIFWAK